MRWQFLPEEICRSFVSADPALPQQQVVNFVGDDDFFEVDMLRFQALHQVCGLLERHIAIVIAMNQQYGRLPL
jgi:hypothetical protein